MKIGQTVVLWIGRGCYEATLVAIVGTGPSMNKVLDLECDGVMYSAVQYRDDCVAGPYWTLPGELAHVPEPEPEPAPEPDPEPEPWWNNAVE